MPAPVVGEKVLVTIVGESFNQRIMNTFWYYVWNAGAAASHAIMQTRLVNTFAMQNGMLDKFVACCPSTYVAKEVWAQTIFPTRYQKSDFEFNEPGLRPAAVTANVAAVITRRGEFANKHSVGRLHVPLTTDPLHVNNGVIVPGVATKLALSELAAKMLLPVLDPTQPANGEWRPILCDARNPGAGAFEYLTDSVVQDTVRVMRRRTVGVGI